MGKMKNLEIELQCNDKPFQIQRAVYKELFKVTPQSDIDYVLKNARGNNKVAMVLALGDIKGE